MASDECSRCGDTISGRAIWVNPLGAGARDLEGALHLGPSVGTEQSGGGYAPYHPECAEELWPGIAHRDVQ